eukprot:TRINITY_DN23729_c0_g1_i1.p1 TRINITY_DN23729_c0_g1~~TRINITY_DN23729_c0_g1_i1.p1  ORF type:complete len:1169 (+),score=291.15 TRINITY_DN23729_c0_g1_i1:24-3509(+)
MKPAPKSPAKQGLSKSFSLPSLTSPKAASSKPCSPKASSLGQSKSSALRFHESFGEDPQAEVQSLLKTCTPLGRPMTLHAAEKNLFNMPTEGMQGLTKLWALIEFGVKNSSWQNFTRGGQLEVLTHIAQLLAQEKPPPPLDPEPPEEIAEVPLEDPADEDADALDGEEVAEAPAAAESPPASPASAAPQAEDQNEDSATTAAKARSQKKLVKIAKQELRRAIEKMHGLRRFVHADEKKAIVLARLCKWSLDLPRAARLLQEALDDVVSAEYSAAHVATLMQAFMPERQKAFAIEDVEQRAMSIGQLHAVRQFCTDNCKSWRDVDPQSPSFGRLLNESALNLYHVNSWVILPATENDCCSFIELIATCPQPADYFVSHWWGERHFDFIQCVETYAKRKKLHANSMFWVCAYANRQHSPSMDVKANPTQNSFYRVMELADFKLLVVLNGGEESGRCAAKEATAFSRVWCAFEISQCIGRDLLQLDFATRSGEGVYVITSGLLPSESKAEDAHVGAGLQSKVKREAVFPHAVALAGLSIKLELAKSSIEMDRTRILNSLAGRPARELDSPPPSQHEKIERANRRLNSMLARCFLCLAGSHASGELAEAVRKAMQNDADCTKLHLRLGGHRSRSADEEELQFVMTCMPSGLKELSVDLAGSQVGDMGLEGMAQKLSDEISQLELSLVDCHNVTDSGICKLVTMLAEKQNRGRGLGSFILTLHGSGVGQQIRSMAQDQITSPAAWFSRLCDDSQTRLFILKSMLSPFVTKPLEDKGKFGQIVSFCKTYGYQFQVKGPYAQAGAQLTVRSQDQATSILLTLDRAILDYLWTNDCRLYFSAMEETMPVGMFAWKEGKTSKKVLPAFSKINLPAEAADALDGIDDFSLASLTAGTIVVAEFPLGAQLEDKLLVYAARCNDAVAAKEVLPSVSSRRALDTARSPPDEDGFGNLGLQDHWLQEVLSGPVVVNAAAQGSCEVLELCLEHELDLEAQEHGWTALRAAARLGQAAAATALLKRGACVVPAAKPAVLATPDNLQAGCRVQRNPELLGDDPSFPPAEGTGVVKTWGDQNSDLPFIATVLWEGDADTRDYRIGYDDDFWLVLASNAEEDRQDYSALDLAAAYGHEDAVLAILDANPPASLVEKAKEVASRFSREEIVVVLIGHLKNL